MLLSHSQVDGRVLNSLTKEDLKKHLRMIKKSEQLSFLSGVELLRMHDFNREVGDVMITSVFLLIPRAHLLCALADTCRLRVK